jgi:glycine cleavage system H protein
MAEKSIIKDGLSYTADHEWVKVEGDNVKMGITDHAQIEMTEVVFVELPKKGQKLQRGDVIGQVESVKTVASVYAPVGGEVVEVNSELESSSQFINEDPYGKGWLVTIKMDDPETVKQLMTPEAYRKLINDQ